MGETPLYKAVKLGCGSIARLFLDAGAHVNMCNGSDFNPLHVAVKGGYLPIVNDLLHKGAKVALHDSLGSTALDCAYLNESSFSFLRDELIKLLRPLTIIKEGCQSSCWALCMTMHPRVGAKSSAHVLSQSIFQEICSYVTAQELAQDQEALAG